MSEKELGYFEKIDTIEDLYDQDGEVTQLSIWTEASLVRKGNPLIKSRMSWPLNAQKILLLLASSYTELTNEFGDKFVKDKDKNFWSIPVSALEDQLGVKRLSSTYLKDLAQVMVQTSIEINLPTTKEGEYAWRMAPLFADATYQNGTLSLELTRLCKEQLGRFTSGYTQYYLKNVIRMRSQYSIRIYELINAEKFKAPIGAVTYSVDELRLLIGVAEDSYKTFGIFNSKVIGPSVDEINEIDGENLYVGYTKLRTGRSITHIKFLYIDKNRIKEEANNKINSRKHQYNSSYDIEKLQESLKLDKKMLSYDWRYYYDLALAAIDAHRKSYESLKNLELDDDYIVYNYLKRNYEYVKKRADKNFDSYFVASLTNDYAGSFGEMEKY